MDDRRFDALAIEVAEEHPSRRLMLKGLFAAAVAGIPMLETSLDAFGRRRRRKRKHKKGKKTLLRCSGDSCDGTGGKPCGGRDDCQCYRAASGGNVCASSLQSSCDITCQSNRDCPNGQVCVEGGPACCGNGTRFCKAACYK
jgi:hypothetical protein